MTTSIDTAIGIILAGGNSTRFGTENKQLALLKGKTVLEHSIDAFSHHPLVHVIMVVCPLVVWNTLPALHNKAHILHVLPGKTRFQSMKNGLENIPALFTKNNPKILVHNGANPLVKTSDIDTVLCTIQKGTAVGVGHRLYGTVREKTPNGWEKLPRTERWELQTPQGALYSDFITWIQSLPSQENTYHDELSLAEHSGAHIVLVPSSFSNRKITNKNDFYSAQESFFSPIIGLGKDSHRFENTKGKPCILCGIPIDFPFGFLANSDGDVGIHALCNALLSACGEGSFSAIADPLCQKGITNSLEYLQVIYKKIKTKGFSVSQINMVFEGKYPKLEPYFPQFREALSSIIPIQKTSIGINATTGESLDEVGQGKGMRCTVQVLLSKKTNI